MNRHNTRSRGNESTQLHRGGGDSARNQQAPADRQAYHPSRGYGGPQGGERYNTTPRWDSEPADPRSSFENVNYGNDERHGDRDAFFGSEGYGADRYGSREVGDYGQRPYADLQTGNSYEQDRGPLGLAGAYGLDPSYNGDQGGGMRLSDARHGYGKGYGLGFGQYDTGNRRQEQGGGRDSGGYQGANQSNQAGWNALNSAAGGYGPASRSDNRRAGPKGYQRSDDRIKDEVCERLYNSYDLDVEDVSVEVGAGQVCLDGTVPERYMKHRIEDIVDQIHGVTDIDNRLKVRRQGSTDKGSASGSKPRDESEAIAIANATEGAEDGGGAGSSGAMAESGERERAARKSAATGKT